MSELITTYSKYHLYRWSLLIRKRDGNVCYCCKRQCLTKREIRKEYVRIHLGRYHGKEYTEALERLADLDGLLAEAHHIRAKYHYPHLALELDNGVTLCWRCHRKIIHATYDTFRIHVFAFRMYTLRDQTANQFNINNQHRVQPRKRSA